MELVLKDIYMHQSVLLSIKPKYVDAIIRGEKLFEFRKAIFRSNDIKRVYIYASSPVQKIVGYFNLEGIIKGHPSEIWEECSELGGISEHDFFEYYRGKTKAFSLKISELTLFDNAVCPYSTFNNFTPPQSFMYFDKMESEL